MEYNSFLEKIMSNYYYPGQHVLLKQSSQIIQPNPLHQSSHMATRSSYVERQHQDTRNSLVFTAAHPIQRDGSSKHLYEVNLNKPEGQVILQTKASVILESPKMFSDYQIGGTPRGEDNQLPSGGGYNIIHNKIGEKIKNKADLHKSSSKTTLNSSEHNLQSPSIRVVESILDGEKAESKHQAIVELINSQIAKMTEKMTLQEERIGKLEKITKKNEENCEKTFSSPQMQEINKILKLVEKTQQRDDYKRAMKMIEQLRGNILQLHQQIKSVSLANQTPNGLDLKHQQLLKSIFDDLFRQKKDQFKSISQKDIRQLSKKMEGLQAWKKSQDEQYGNMVTSSLKKFEGKITTLVYQQKLMHTSQNCQSGLNIGVLKGTPKNDLATDKENSTTLTLTAKTYYIDTNGYLLDKNKYYLLNQKNEQIRLTDKEIDLLRKHNIL